MNSRRVLITVHFSILDQSHRRSTLANMPCGYKRLRENINSLCMRLDPRTRKSQNHQVGLQDGRSDPISFALREVVESTRPSYNF